MKKCCESRANEASWSSRRGRDGPAEAIDRVQPAPEDAIVRGQSVVVELVRPLADSLASLPADRGALRRVERLAHQRVVVHGSDVAAQRAKQGREGAGRQDHPARAHAPLWRDQLDAGRPVAQVAGRRVLEQPYAGVKCRAPQAEGELARVDERRARALEQPSVVGRGCDLGTRRRGVEHRDVVAEAPVERSRLVELLEQRRVQHDGQLAGSLELALDAETGEIGDEAVEVLAPEPLELDELVGEPREPVLEPVCQRRVREPAVAAARAEPARLTLEDDHVAARIAGLRVERRPEPGEAAADDAQIAVGRCRSGREPGPVGRARRARTAAARPRRRRLAPPCVGGLVGHAITAPRLVGRSRGTAARRRRGRRCTGSA